ncbi:MAG: hypothetical protein ABUS54_05330 [Actinomycetota bacterium]
MRRTLACLAVALALPAAAGATSMPPLRGLPSTVTFVPLKENRASCSEPGRSSKVARLARKLAPVACEQPPKPKLRQSDTGSFLGP